MILCNDDHDEVVFDDDTRHCPVCLVLKDLQALEKELEAEQAKVLDLETQLEDAKAE